MNEYWREGGIPFKVENWKAERGKREEIGM